MTLMRAFSVVDEQGRISIPRNIQKEARLKPGQLVEVKVQGPTRDQFIVIHKRKAAR